MTTFALPCIVCGAELRNIDEASTNQPHKGTAFMTHGHYGSTSFDPMDGRYLELNLCDECVVRLGHEGKILLGQSHKLVTMPGPAELHGMPTVIGKMPIYRELTPWNPDVESETEAAHLDTYDEYFEWRDKIESRFTDEEIQEMFEWREANDDRSI